MPYETPLTLTAMTVDLPYTWSSSDAVSWPTAHTEYISDWEYASGTDANYLHPSDITCYQFFTFRMNAANDEGSSMPGELQIDVNTGILTL
jgi:hypothetical protein